MVSERVIPSDNFYIYIYTIFVNTCNINICSLSLVIKRFTVPSIVKKKTTTKLKIIYKLNGFQTELHLSSRERVLILNGKSDYAVQNYNI